MRKLQVNKQMIQTFGKSSGNNFGHADGREMQPNVQNHFKGNSGNDYPEEEVYTDRNKQQLTLREKLSG